MAGKFVAHASAAPFLNGNKGFHSLKLRVTHSFRFPTILAKAGRRVDGVRSFMTSCVSQRGVEAVNMNVHEVGDIFERRAGM
jgi:hypothetical protein